MKFEANGAKYEVDRFGVIVQKDYVPYVYDEHYSAVYDKPEYVRQSEILQALRLGFVQASHGSPVNSILDIGYGNGAFMKFAKQYVQYVYGNDVTGVVVDSCYIMPEIIKADVITMWDVLEHFHDVSFLASLPCETVVISLPYCHFHTQGLEWLMFKYKHLKKNEHIRHFNEFSLANLMSFYGWKSVALSGHEDIVRKSLHGLQNILTMAFKRK